MSKLYTCKLEKLLFSAWVNTELELSSQDYLFCEDESDLRYTVEEDLRYALNMGDVQYKDCDLTFEIPQDFINEWNKLKQKELCN